MCPKNRSRKFYAVFLLFSAVLFFAFSLKVMAFQSVNDISVETAATYDIVTVSLSSSTQYKVFTLKNPARLVLDLDNCEYPKTKKPILMNTKFISSIHGGQYRETPVKKARIVIDLKNEVNYSADAADNQILIELTEKPGASKEKEPVKPKIAKKQVKKPVIAKKKSSVTAIPKNKTLKSPLPVSVSTESQQSGTAIKSTGTAATNVPDQQQKNLSTSGTAPVKKNKKPVKKKILPNIPDDKHQDLLKRAREEEKKLPVKEDLLKPEIQAQPASQQGAASPIKETKDAVPQQESKKDLVTLDFSEADIKDVLQVLAIKKGVNIISGDDVVGTVSIHLENIPFEEAMDIILRMKGLVFQYLMPNVIRVISPTTLAKERSEAVQNSEVFRLNYSKASEISAKLLSILSAEGQRATINNDDRTNSIIITSTPDGIVAAKKLVAELDTKPEQVSIEAKIVEISVGDTKDLGIEWSLASGDVGSGKNVGIGGNKGASGNSFGTTEDGQNEILTGTEKGGTGVSAPPQNTVGAFSFGYLRSDILLSARLAAAQSKGKAKILSQPRISTLNNMEAKIIVGGQIPFTQTTIGAGGVSTQTTAFLTVGIQLSVTPTINADGRITMKIKPQVSNVSRITAIGPETTTKDAETTVLVKNGETIVIGGLITQNERKDASQIPLLGDLPVLGAFFRSSHDENSKTELIIFVTPYIMKD